MKIFEGKRVHIKSWCNNPEEGAIQQALNLSSLPFIFKHVCLMSDCHEGYGMPIGGVIATKNIVIPNAVGVDIGCGMLSVETDIDNLDKDQIKSIMGKIRGLVPVGFNHHKTNQEWNGFNNIPLIDVIRQEVDSARKQLGTLGGGNHFIELQTDGNHIHFMIHSGSRNFGYKIAKHFNEVATKLCHRWYSNIPEIKGEDGLAFLPIDTNEGLTYFTAMSFALDFAQANRNLMAERVKEAINSVVSCNFEESINIHHNYARLENHFKHNVIIHRKGATSAKENEIGIIPGSQGSYSYIVHGLGNPESFYSCSHGAGRKMSRKKARETLEINQETEKMGNIVHSIRNKQDLDEAPGAYKDIDIVMEEQQDLVAIKKKLYPLGVIKG